LHPLLAFRRRHQSGLSLTEIARGAKVEATAASDKVTGGADCAVWGR
jgi:hypothetical protein